jgi:ABC-type uncharacterized transport system involved in gliding motility auxiliary subunit
MATEKKVISAKSARWQARVSNWLTVVLTFAIVVMVNYLGFRYYLRKDFSQNRYFELSEKTVQVLKGLKEPVKITTCLNSSALQREIEGLLKEYQFRGGDKIQIERVDVAMDVERAEALSKKFHFDLRENLVIFEYKDRNKYVNEQQIAEIDNSGIMMGRGPQLKAFKGEQQFTATIQALVEGDAAKVYFLTGHGERDIDDQTTPAGYGEAAARIRRENIELTKLNLAEGAEVPKDAQALIIAGPQAALSAQEIQIISAYLDRQGKVVVLQDVNTVSGLEPLLQKYGMTLDKDLVVARVRYMGNEVLLGAIGTQFAPHPSVKPLAGFNIQFGNARSISVAAGGNGAASKVTKLIETAKDFWGETHLGDPKAVYDPAADLSGPLTLAALYDSGEVPGEAVSVSGTRLLAVGSSTFLVNQNIDVVGVDFITNALNWMIKKDAAIGISPKVPQEYSLNLTPLQLRTISWLAATLVPLAALLLGGFVWYSRRK